MTFRKQLVMMVMGIILVTILLNAGMINLMIRNNFSDFIERQYERQVTGLVSAALDVLEKGMAGPELAMQLEGRLPEGILGVVLYDLQGDLVLSLEMKDHMMASGMMGKT